MKLLIESTDRIVQLEQAGSVTVPARIWEGTTERGVRCLVFITRVAVREDQDTAEFERDLTETPPPKAAPDVQSWPARMVL